MNTSTISIKIFRMIVLLGAITLFGANIVIAGTYYVSNSGSATWASAANINTPCSVYTAFSNAQAGDVVYIRGGIYTLPPVNKGNAGFRGALEPVNSGTGDAENQRIIFRAYSKESPILNGTANGTSDRTYESTIIATLGKDYLTFDGLTFQSDGGTLIGRLFVGNESSTDSGGLSIGTNILNCTFYGGSKAAVTGGDNAEGLRLQNTQTTLVQNCLFYNYLNSDGINYNTSAIKTYHTTGTTVVNCEIFKSTIGLYWKQDSSSVIVRNNYIHNCYRGVYHANGPYPINNTIYNNNVFSNCSYIGLQIIVENGQSNTGATVYNNTFYSSTNSGTYCFFFGTSGTSDRGVNNKYYNNIILGSQYKATFPYPGPSSLIECDYNQYGNSGSFLIYANYGGSSRNYTSLTSWKASTEANGSKPDVHSLASDPKFTNASGNYSLLTDFTLQTTSPCKGMGLGGGDIGANINLVGVSSNLPPTQDITKPAAPTGVSIRIIQ
jgi:hypothetical protein